MYVKSHKKFLNISIKELTKNNSVVLEQINEIISYIMEWYVIAKMYQSILEGKKTIIIHAGLAHTTNILVSLQNIYKFKILKEEGLTDLDQYNKISNGCLQLPSDIEKQFYLSNNLNWFNNQLPNYDVITIQRIVLLVQQKKYELSNYTTDLSSLKILQNSMDNILTDYVNYDYYLNIMSIVSATFHIFIFAILILCRMISCCGYEKIMYMPIILMVLAVIPDTICFSLLGNLKIRLSDYDQDILKLRSSNYFLDDIINETFSQLFIIFDILNYQFFICSIIFIISSAIIILPFIYFLCHVIMSMRII